MAKPKIYNRYENMDFPKYVYKEYPKIIGPQGNRVHVASPEEEEAARAELKLPAMKIGKKNELMSERKD